MKNIKRIVSIMLICLLVASPTYAMLRIRPSPSAPEGMKPMVEGIVGLIQFAGYAIAFSMLVYVGIKYTTSSADGKADVKKDSIRFLVGALIVISCTTLFGMIVKFFESAKDGSDDQVYYQGYLETHEEYI